MLDCIDIHIEVPRVDYEKLSGGRMEETSEASLKLARTIAHLAGSEEIQSTYPAEALQYRPKLMHSTM